MTPAASQVLQAIKDKDLIKLKHLIPDKSAYDNAVNGKDISPSTANADLTKEKTEKAFVSALLSAQSMSILAHFLSIDAFSDQVAFSFLKKSIKMAYEPFAIPLLKRGDFSSGQTVELLSLASRHSSYNIRFQALDKVDANSSDLFNHKDAYTDIVTRVENWRSGDHKNAFLMGLLNKYPGAIQAPNIMNQVRYLIPDFDISFEKTAQLLSDRGIHSFLRIDDDNKYILQAASLSKNTTSGHNPS